MLPGALVAMNSRVMVACAAVAMSHLMERVDVALARTQRELGFPVFFSWGMAVRGRPGAAGRADGPGRTRELYATKRFRRGPKVIPMSQRDAV